MPSSTQSETMNFLNQIATSYPAAISLAAGRPSEHLFDNLDHASLLSAIRTYEAHYGARGSLLQYGPTAGLVRDLIADQLRIDQGVPATAERTIVTTGCQEGLALCLSVLCPDPTDVLLVRNPTYVGATGAANLFKVLVVALDGSSGADLPTQIQQAIVRERKNGRTVRAVYLIPDFDNPTGEVIGLSDRKKVIDICAYNQVVILEDNPYGLFRYEGIDVPSMAALDVSGCVIHLATYSKTIAPALRTGALALPESLFGDRLALRTCLNRIVERKSFLTVNTSQLTQAIVGGLLLEQDGSLRSWIEPSRRTYQENLSAMTAALRDTFGESRTHVSWNNPAGGFFLTLNLPFDFTAADVDVCATRYKVIAMPMSFFAMDNSQDNRARLSFSAASSRQIQTAVENFGRYVDSRTTSHLAGHG
jgi:(S)-3,5-dihydroxyphenylglycine transaminase